MRSIWAEIGKAQTPVRLEVIIIWCTPKEFREWGDATESGGGHVVNQVGYGGHCFVLEARGY